MCGQTRPLLEFETFDPKAAMQPFYLVQSYPVHLKVVQSSHLKAHEMFAVCMQPVSAYLHSSGELPCLPYL